MMSFHFSILITTAENGGKQEMGTKEDSGRRRAFISERKRLNYGNGINRDSLPPILNVVNCNVV